MRGSAICAPLLVWLAAAGCAQTPEAPAEGFGPTPVLPAPDSSFIPTVNVAPAAGWSANEKPHAADGFSVGAFATGLDHPSWLLALPNGDVLVAETNAPPRPMRLRVRKTARASRDGRWASS
jgi:glucose/arabinose dehydrogenase